MTEEDLRKYFEIYTDCWKLFRKYSNPDSADEFWQNLVDETEMLHKKHAKTEFCRKLLLETVNEIERIFKEKRKE